MGKMQSWHLCDNDVTDNKHIIVECAVALKLH